MPCGSMDLLVDVLLMLAAWVLVVRSNSDQDEVWALCLRILAVVSTLAVITSARGQPLALLLLAFALWLPGADRLEERDSSALEIPGARRKRPPSP